MNQHVMLFALLGTAAARPQLLQIPQLVQGTGVPGSQVITLVPFNGGVPLQNQPGQVSMIPSSSGVPSFGGIQTLGGLPSFGGAPLMFLHPVGGGQAPVVGTSLVSLPVPTAPVAPVPAQVVVNPVTAAPVTVPPPPPVQPVAVPTTVSVPVAAPAKPVSVSVMEKPTPAKYSHSYEVNDPSTSDVKSACESRDGDKVTGFYTVADPDGTLRRVEYTADVNGFVAVVNTKPSGVALPVVAKPVVAVGRIPVANAANGANVLAQFTSPVTSFRWGSA